jgi:hypothetical protein
LRRRFKCFCQGRAPATSLKAFVQQRTPAAGSCSSGRPRESAARTTRRPRLSLPAHASTAGGTARREIPLARRAEPGPSPPGARSASDSSVRCWTIRPVAASHRRLR